MRRLSILAALLFILILLPLQPREAECCASVWRNKNGPVAIVEESAVIVWDSAQKVQHFIRWASFDSDSKDFGFLVPTPTQPVLKEAAEGAFATLAQWIAPKVVHARQWSFAPLLSCVFGYGSAPREGSDSAPVRVLDRQIVGGFDAAVLEADDAEALRLWLEKNGYVARPELTSWLGPYIADGWKITAFKIAQAPGGGRAVQTSPVRMSFRTERPFFPYREPEDAKEPTSRHAPERLLRVYFIGAKRMRGLLGTTPWSARVPYSNPLDESQRTELVKSLGLEDQDLPANARLTVFDDPSSPRPGNAEVFFDEAADQSNVTPPPRTVYTRIWVPGDVMVMALLLVMIGLPVLLRRKNG